MSETMTNKLNDLCKKDIKTASNEELYHALLKLVDEKSQQQVHSVTGRKLYYITLFSAKKQAFLPPFYKIHAKILLSEFLF